VLHVSNRPDRNPGSDPMHSPQPRQKLLGDGTFAACRRTRYCAASKKNFRLWAVRGHSYGDRRSGVRCDNRQTFPGDPEALASAEQNVADIALLREPSDTSLYT
jgi:hypothetical protein